MDKEQPIQEQVKEIIEACDAESIEGTDDIYDETASDESHTFTLNPLLTDAEKELATFWAQELDHAVILLHGPLGSGKGTIGNWIGKFLGKWCLDKNILMDYKPRPLFDLEYKPQSLINEFVPLAGQPLVTPDRWDDKWGLSPNGLIRQSRVNLWNKEIFVNQIARMGDVAMGELSDGKKELDNPEKQALELDRNRVEEAKRLTGLWISTQGAVKMQNALLLLDEIKRLHPKRNQLNPYGVHMIALYDLLRHLHLAIIGMTAYYNELDENQFLPKVNIEIKCHKAEYCQHTVIGDVYKVRWVASRQGREFARFGDPIVIDGREPQLLLGNYAYSALHEEIDEGELNLKTGIRRTNYIRLESTKGFRDINGVAWLGNPDNKEYIGYENRSDENGKVWDRGYIIGETDVPNALLGVTRRMNWRLNHCEPNSHQRGEPVWTGLGWFDIYNSWNAFGLPVTKGMKA